MATARQILEQKREPLAWLPATATALTAAELMNDRHIGSVVIMSGRRIIGIFTERDVLRRIVATGRDPGSTPVVTVMTTPVAVAAPHTRIDELRYAMRDRRIRHIPVVDGERPIGMISIGDLNRAQHDDDVETIRYLEQYMSVA